MKRCAALCALALAGCSTASRYDVVGRGLFDDMAKNDFVGVVAVVPPAGLIGRWTGSASSALQTIDLRSDGSALVCNAWARKTDVSKAKFDGTLLRTQEGTRMRLEPSGASTIRVTLPSLPEAPAATFYRDADLSKASVECAKAL